MKNSYSGEMGDNSGVTPDKSNAKVKYASARIKLLRVDAGPVNAEESAKGLAEVEVQSNESTLAGQKGMRRLVEMCINEFYRKRGKSIKSVQREKQVNTLVEFWWQSLSQQKILCKLKGKLSKTGLVEKEKYLLNFLNGKDKKSLYNLQKHSTTRKYGELAILDEDLLR